MPLRAINENGQSINSVKVTDRNQTFICPHCANPLSFVDARLKVKHFRHKVSSTCAYLKGDEVILPSFRHKWAKGNRGTCSNRFIMWRGDTEQIPLLEFLGRADKWKINERYKPPPCPHENVTYVKSDKEIVRYKIVCNFCNAFRGWLPNKDALAKGLSLE